MRSPTPMLIEVLGQKCYHRGWEEGGLNSDWGDHRGLQEGDS